MNARLHPIGNPFFALLWGQAEVWRWLAVFVVFFVVREAIALDHAVRNVNSEACNTFVEPEAQDVFKLFGDHRVVPL